MADRAATLLAFPAREDDRLRLALRGLVAALEAQGEAVATLRGELRGLAESVAGLDGSFGQYRVGLEATAAALRDAGAEAKALERRATGWLAATQG